MYKLITIFITIAMAISSILNAQTKTSKTDTLKMAQGRITVILNDSAGKKDANSLSFTTKKDKKRKPVETHWFSLDLGFNNYQDKTNYGNTTNADDRQFFAVVPNSSKKDFELKTGKSINVNLGIVKTQISLYKHYINLVTGITYDINNWSYQTSLNWNHNPETSLVPLNGYGIFVNRDSSSYKKNKIVTNYLQVPLLLRFETSPTHEKKNIKLSIGGYAGYLMRVHTKQIHKGSDEKRKQFDDFNITKFQYGAQFEISYRSTALYFKKSITHLTEYGTVQYPYSFGIRLLGF